MAFVVIDRKHRGTCTLISGSNPCHLTGPLHSPALSFPVPMILHIWLLFSVKNQIFNSLLPQHRYQCADSRYNFPILPSNYKTYTTRKRNMSFPTSNSMMEWSNWACCAPRDSNLRRVQSALTLKPKHSQSSTSIKIWGHIISKLVFNIVDFQGHYP